MCEKICPRQLFCKSPLYANVRCLPDSTTAIELVPRTTNGIAQRFTGDVANPIKQCQRQRNTGTKDDPRRRQWFDQRPYASGQHPADTIASRATASSWYTNFLCRASIDDATCDQHANRAWSKSADTSMITPEPITYGSARGNRFRNHRSNAAARLSPLFQCENSW